MALRAGYYGVKRWLWDKLQSVPDKVEGLIENTDIAGVKNFMPNNAVSGTNNGVTYVVGDDKSISTSNTATGYVEIPLFSWTKHNLNNSVDYFLSGCPAGGASTKYRLLLQFSNSADGSSPTNYIDYGSGVKVDDVSKTYWRAMINISSGQSANDLVFKPMLSLLSDTDRTYEPYAMTNQELTNDKVSKTLTSTDTKTTIFSESSKVSSVTAILNDLLVSLRLTSTSGASASGSWTTIATLNETYRPAGLVYEVAIDDAGVPYGWIRIHGDTGVVEVYQGSGSAKVVNLSTLYFRNTSASANRDAAPDERSLDVEVEEPVVVKKTTRKKTTKTEEEE